MRGRFDVTGKIRPGAEATRWRCALSRTPRPAASRRRPSPAPDLNGGALGADNPTYHATIGWDWIPTIRGRDTGIWGDVYLTTTGPVTIENPFVTTTLPLPDTSRADVAIAATLRNSGAACGRRARCTAASATWLSKARSTLEAGASRTVDVQRRCTCDHPKLWWPNGYGEQNLYPVELTFDGRRAGLRHQAFQAGIRQFTYSEDGGALRIWINGRRFIARGGNWGFPESMLRYRAREYDAAVRYHQDMNFTMIRNWVGQIGDEAFYDACDRYGIVVWQDFWLANPVDGPNPDDNAMFLANARDYILRIRNHPSVGLYVGRNEGYPPEPHRGRVEAADGLAPSRLVLHSQLRRWTRSAGTVRTAREFPKFYFEQRATTKLHSEIGMPNVVTMDSLKQMMPEADMWPQGDVWGMHDFTSTGAQGAAAWRDMIDKTYGGAASAAEFVELSPVHRLRRLPRHVRGAGQEPHGRAAVDEPSLLAVASCGRPTIITSTRAAATSAPRRARSRCTSSGTR